MITDIITSDDREAKDRSSRMIMLDLYKELIPLCIEVKALVKAVKDKDDPDHTHAGDYKAGKKEAEQEYKEAQELVDKLMKGEEKDLMNWTKAYKRSLKKAMKDDSKKKKQSLNSQKQMDSSARKMKKYDYIDKDDDDDD